jgi:hypothetical protein
MLPTLAVSQGLVSWCTSTETEGQDSAPKAHAESAAGLGTASVNMGPPVALGFGQARDSVLWLHWRKSKSIRRGRACSARRPSTKTSARGTPPA